MTGVPDPLGPNENARDADLAATVVQAKRSGPGTMIGPYRVVGQLGEGGMGVVYHAQQQHPIRRDVALKLIKPGMDSRQVIARFASERQALALMDHPNIARVLDAGATEAGLPYFVMEYVAGVPITRYCDSKRLPLRERMELFVPVCRAIQHAHQKGIIHRDIKPSNILVGEREGRPAPMVIDFGLAKALGDGLSDATMMTTPGAVVGTLRYMSPEQAELGRQDIDTRSDVYSLGVVLYELVTGTTPLEDDSVTGSSYLEILQRIREEEPAPPSSRMRGLSNSAEIAQRRQSDPARYPRLLHGELDWIVMKALEKERSRRYETANAMVRDIERYLAGETPEAAPASAGYRMKKLLRKHRIWLATAAAFVMLLVAGVVATSWMAIRATRAEREAVQERNAAKSVSDFLQDDLLAQASAARQAGQGAKPDPELKVRTALDRASARIEGKFAGQPLIEASIRQTIGSTYEQLGLYREAEGHLERALAIRRRELGEQHVETARSLRLLATLRWDQGAYGAAETVTRQALEIQRHLLGEEHPNTLNSMNTLAAALAYQGKHAQAEELFRKILDIERRVLGEENGQTLYVMNNLAAVQFRQGRFAEAEKLHEEALKVRRRLNGEDHPATLNSVNNLGEVFHAEGRYGEAEAVHAKALEVRRRVLGEEHPDTLHSLRNLAAAYGAQNRYAQAEPMFAQVLEIRRRVLGEEHPKTVGSMKDLALLYQSSGRIAQAERLLTSAMAIQRRGPGVAHPDALDTLVALGAMRVTQQRFSEGEGLLREAVVAFEKAAPESWQRYRAQHLLGASLSGQKRYAEAEPLLLAGHQGLTRLEATIPAQERFSKDSLIGPIVRLYEQWGQPAKASAWKLR